MVKIYGQRTHSARKEGVCCWQSSLNVCLPFLLPTHEHPEGIGESTLKSSNTIFVSLSQLKASSRVYPVMSHRLSPVDAIYIVPPRYCAGVVVCCGSTSSNPSSNTTHVREYKWNSLWVITKCILWLYLDWRPTVFLLWEGVTATHLTKFGLVALGLSILSQGTMQTCASYPTS